MNGHPRATSPEAAMTPRVRGRETAPEGGEQVRQPRETKRSQEEHLKPARHQHDDDRVRAGLLHLPSVCVLIFDATGQVGEALGQHRGPPLLAGLDHGDHISGKAAGKSRERLGQAGAGPGDAGVHVLQDAAGSGVGEALLEPAQRVRNEHGR